MAVLVVRCHASAQEPKWPAPAVRDFVARDFRFASGETLPELRLHYRTIGKLVRDERGHAQNAVLILHGTTGSGANFLRPEPDGELFERGGLLRDLPKVNSGAGVITRYAVGASLRRVTGSEISTRLPRRLSSVLFPPQRHDAASTTEERSWPWNFLL